MRLDETRKEEVSRALFSRLRREKALDIPSKPLVALRKSVSTVVLSYFVLPSKMWPDWKPNISNDMELLKLALLLLLYLKGKLERLLHFLFPKGAPWSKPNK